MPLKDPEARRVYNREYNKTRVKKPCTWRKRNPEKANLIYLRSRLKTKFSLSIREYEELLAKQENACAICQVNTSAFRGTNLAVDHDHTTGKVRGLLCGFCNSMLGMAKDNVAVLVRAVEYLESDKRPGVKVESIKESFAATVAALQEG